MACNKNKRFSVPFVVVFGTNEMIKFKLIKPFDNFIKAEEERKTNDADVIEIKERNTI